MQESKNFLQNAGEPHEDYKFEVGVDFSNGEPQVIIRQLTWTDGLGWCVQKTVRVPADRLEDLHGAITAARHQIARRKSDTGDFRPAKVLQFPRSS